MWSDLRDLFARTPSESGFPYEAAAAAWVIARTLERDGRAAFVNVRAASLPAPGRDYIADCTDVDGLDEARERVGSATSEVELYRAVLTV